MIRLEDRPQSEEARQKAADLVISVTGRAFEVSRTALMAKSRSRTEIAFARQVAMYLLHIVFGLTYKDTGDCFGRERTTVAYACSSVEDSRDDIDLDRKLDTLTESLERLWAVERLRQVRELKKSLKAQAAA